MSTPLVTESEERRTGVGVIADERMRTDIQALRGLAILLVVVYHSRLFTPLQAGYLGVDIFFVISGYLITGIIQRGLQAGTFSFAAFYGRRAKRLLPAAYVTLTFTIVFAPLFLTQSEMKDFVWQTIGTVTFTGNIALWKQTGYFEGAAHLKPLLHVWSLSIEEQYYALLPAALALTPQRFWRTGTLIFLAGSLVLCFVLIAPMPGATFFLLPTRAWELALGSLGAIALDGSGADRWIARLFWPAFLVMLVLPFFPTGAPHPGLDALLICASTIVVMRRKHPLLNQGFATRAMAWLGDISYPLYLVHWPLLAFAANAWVSPIPGIARLTIVVFAVVAASGLYRWVEQPVRRKTIAFNRRNLTVTILVSAILIASVIATAHLTLPLNSYDHADPRRGNLGLDVSCDFEKEFVPKPKCRTSDAPRILVWGDSYAMHLMDGIAATSLVGVAQATKATCGPFVGVSAFDLEGWYNRTWAEGCVAFNDSVLSYIAATPSVEVVVLASLYGQYLAGNRLLTRTVGTSTDIPNFVVASGSEANAVAALNTTIAAIRKLGRRVVLVAPPPSGSGVDFGRCLELKAEGKAVLGADRADCSISERRYRDGRAPVRSLLDRVSRESGVAVVHLDEYLCKDGICVVELDHVALYRDHGHLSYEGSRVLGKKIGLTGILMNEAR